MQNKTSKKKKFRRKISKNIKKSKKKLKGGSFPFKSNIYPSVQKFQTGILPDDNSITYKPETLLDLVSQNLLSKHPTIIPEMKKNNYPEDFTNILSAMQEKIKKDEEKIKKDEFQLNFENESLLWLIGMGQFKYDEYDQNEKIYLGLALNRDKEDFDITGDDPSDYNVIEPRYPNPEKNDPGFPGRPGYPTEFDPSNAYVRLQNIKLNIKQILKKEIEIEKNESKKKDLKRLYTLFKNYAFWNKEMNCWILKPKMLFGKNKNKGPNILLVKENLDPNLKDIIDQSFDQWIEITQDEGYDTTNILKEINDSKRISNLLVQIQKKKKYS